MSLLVKITLAAALILNIAIPSGAFAMGKKTKGRHKIALSVSAFLSFGTLIVSSVFMFSGNASAAETTAATSGVAGMGYLAAALSTGLACIGGGIAISAAASATLGAISEGGSILGKSLTFAGLVEGVCLYGLVISLMILGKLQAMKVYLISDNTDTYIGLRLAGVEGAVVHEKEQLKEELDKVMANKEIGVVLLTEKFSRDCPDLVNQAKLSKMPLFVEIPDRHGTGRKPNFITPYANEAIGLKL